MDTVHRNIGNILSVNDLADISRMQAEYGTDILGDEPRLTTLGDRAELQAGSEGESRESVWVARETAAALLPVCQERPPTEGKSDQRSSDAATSFCREKAPTGPP